MKKKFYFLKKKTNKQKKIDERDCIKNQKRRRKKKNKNKNQLTNKTKGRGRQQWTHHRRQGREKRYTLDNIRQL